MKKIIVVAFVLLVAIMCMACESEEDRKQIVKNRAEQYFDSNYDEYGIDKVEKIEDDSYYAYGLALVSGKYYDLTERVRLNIYKDGEKWEISEDIGYEERKIRFHENDEYFYCYYKGRNYAELFKMVGIDEGNVAVEYYGHSIVSTGSGYFMSKDTFWHGTEDLSYEFDEELRCVTFTYRMTSYHYQIYPNDIIVGVDENKGGEIYTEYKKATPENPNAYWWFEKAQNSTDDVDGELSDTNDETVQYENETNSDLNMNEQSTQSQDQTKPTTENNEEVSNKPEKVETISGTSASGKIQSVDQCNKYVYKAPNTGIYWFGLDISNVNANYVFKIVNSKGAELVKEKYSSVAHYSPLSPGVNVNFTAGEEYTVMINQETDLCDYSFTIGIPNDTINVSGNVIKGKIAYIGQENSYIYDVKKTGEYIFYLDISDVNSNYEVIIKNSKNATVASVKYSQAAYANSRAEFGLNLNAGKYTITVMQDNRLCDYTVEIKTP